MQALTNKQELFCQEYLIDLNGTQAYLRSHPKADGNQVSYMTAQTESSRLLVKPLIASRIKELLDERKDQINVNAEFVLRSLLDVAAKCQQAKPVLVWDPVAKEMVQKTDGEARAVYEFDAQGANRALELVGRHLGIFEKDNKQKHNDAMSNERFAAMLDAVRGK